MKNCLSCDHYCDSYGRCREGYSPGSCERELAVDEAYSQMIRSEREEKKITNGDRIRNMTDEELAEWLSKEASYTCNICIRQNEKSSCVDYICEECVAKWLKQEVPKNEGVQL